MLARLALGVARSRPGGAVLGLVFERAPHALPLRRELENAGALAFRHPRPSYDPHLVVVPKRRVPDLQRLAALPHYADAVLAAATEVARRRATESWALWANGGSRQEVGQVHFHVFATSALPSLDWEQHVLIDEEASFGFSLAAAMAAIGSAPAYAVFVEDLAAPDRVLHAVS